MKRFNVLPISLYVLLNLALILPGWAAGSFNLEIAGRLESPPLDVSVQGSYAYAVGKGSFTIYDVQDPAHPIQAGACRLPDWGIDVSVKGDYATIACLSAGFILVDIKNPESPQIAGQIMTASRTVNAAWDGKLACLAEEKDGMKLVDASSPSQVRVLYHTTEDIFTMTQLKGHYAYAIGSCGLYIWDITNPRTPQLLSITSGVNYLWEALEVDDNYLYTGAGYLKIYDISDPSQPFCISSSFRLPYCISLKKQGSVLHWAGYKEYALVSVEDPYNPQLLASSSTGIKYAHRVDYNNQASFIADLYAGLICYNYTSTSLTPLMDISGRGKVVSLAYHQPYLYVAETSRGIGCFDITSSHYSREAGRLDLADSETLTWHNGYLYSMSTDTMTVISLSEGTAMSVVNTFYLYNGGSRPDDKLPILFHGNYLYLLSHSTSTLFQYLLQIYDITKPEEAYLASTMDFGEGNYYGVGGDLAAEDSTLYLRGFVYDTSDSSHGMNLVAYDISDPTQPLFKNLIPMSFRTENPFWMRHNYFFCFSENSVYVGKILADSSTAQMVGKYSTRLPIVDYSLIGSKAFLVLTNGELVILDIRIPENLKCLGDYPVGSYETGPLAGDSGILCQAEGAGGVSIFQLSSHLPALKLRLGEGLDPAYALSDYFLTDSTATFQLDKNALGLAQLTGDTVTQSSYNQATVEYHRYAITQDEVTNYPEGYFKYSSYRLHKLPEAVLSQGRDFQLSLTDYLDKTEGMNWPESFGNQEALLVSDTVSLQAQWDNSSTVKITCLQSFVSPCWVDVIASPQSQGPFPNAADQDWERIWVYPNMIPQGGFSVASETTLFAFEPLTSGESMASSGYQSFITDSEGETAQGVLSFSFDSIASKVKGTLQFNQHLQFSANQWYRARMRIYSPQPGNSMEASLFNFNGIASSTAEHVDVAGQIFFGVPTTWSWMDVPLYTHAADSGYAQFALRGNGEGFVYIDEIQLFKADPPVTKTRCLSATSLPQGDFDEASDLEGWSLENASKDSTSLTIQQGQLEIYTANEFKMTAINKRGGIYTPPTPVNQWVGLQMTLSSSSIFSNYKDFLIILGLYGIQNQGQYEMGVPDSELLASAEFGKIKGGEYWVAGKALNPYHQIQLVIRKGQGQWIAIPDINLELDSDDPNYGEAEMFPLAE